MNDVGSCFLVGGNGLSAAGCQVSLECWWCFHILGLRKIRIDLVGGMIYHGSKQNRVVLGDQDKHQVCDDEK